MTGTFTVCGKVMDARKVVKLEKRKQEQAARERHPPHHRHLHLPQRAPSIQPQRTHRRDCKRKEWVQPQPTTLHRHAGRGRHPGH